MRLREHASEFDAITIARGLTLNLLFYAATFKGVFRRIHKAKRSFRL
jgi:hypothetical protein